MAFVALMVPYWLVMIRVALTGVVMTDQEVKIVNPLQSRRLSIGDVKGFTAGIRGPATAAFAELRSGDRIHLVGVRGPNRFLYPRSRQVKRIVDEMNDELRRRVAAT